MKLVRVEMTYDVIGNLCKSTEDDCIFYKIEGIPKDAKLISINLDYTRRMAYLTFEHESFKDIPEGNKIPLQYIYLTKYYA